MVICTEASPELRERFEQAGCRLIEIGALRRGVDFLKIKLAANILREFQPDIVHGAVFEGVIIATLAGRIARAPIIVAEEVTNPLGRRVTGHIYFRLLTTFAHHVVAISSGVRDYLTQTIKVPKSKVQLIYNGVADPGPALCEQVRAIRQELDLQAGAPVIGTVGRLATPAGQAPDSNKRIADAISAMLLVRERFPTAKLIVVGDGPDRGFLEQFASDAGLSSTVRFAGYRHDVRPFLECMDVLVHPSANEGLPLTLVETMLASRPVVATNIVGADEVVSDGVTGFLVPVGAPDALASRIVELLSSPELAARFGAAGLQRARELFSEDRYVTEIAVFYEELAKKNLHRQTLPK
jgi:glycosyltransferase involved in cell wall biosynthesis